MGVDFLDVLQRLDRGWMPSGSVNASRTLYRPPITKTRPSFVSHLNKILPYGKDAKLEADFEHEYLPFSMAKFAALIKIPSRATTFLEMTLTAARDGTTHVAPLRPFEGDSFSLVACNVGQPDCSASFAFTKSSKLKVFRGAPATVHDVSNALRA